MSGQQNHLMVENMTDLIALVDAQRRFQYVSPSYTSVLGYDADAQIGVPVVSFIHEDDLAKTCETLHDIFRFKQSGIIQYRLRHKNGTYLTVETTYTPIFDDIGSVTSIVLSSRDITEQKRMAKRLELEAALRNAIDEEEFSLYYQPLVNTKTHDIYGAEALIRWITKTGGMISPTDFIPLAEETGLIVEIGAWVLRKACLQVKTWQEQMLKPIRISVNLSTRQFQDPDFLDKVKRIVSETNIAPQWIGLEITESLIMKNVDNAIGTLRELQKMGFEISIDDFGTGYSSLGYLKTLPIDKLKIDQTFIRDLTTKQEDKTITKAIISLAHNLGLKVIAEGVETADHVDFLTQEKCDELQGYYFGKPLSTTDFARCLHPHKVAMP